MDASPAPPIPDNAVRVFTWTPGAVIAEFPERFKAGSFSIRQNVLTSDGWRLEGPAVLNLLDKLRRAGTPLGEYVGGRFYYGIKTGLNEAFVIDRATRDRLIAEDPKSAEILKPFLRGRDVKRWRVEFGEQYLIKIESSENVEHPWSGKTSSAAEKVFAKTYPAIFAWFRTFRARLTKRCDQGKYYWELRSCAYYAEFEKRKIVFPDIAERPQFVYDGNGYFLVNTLYLIPTNEVWLTSVLNSSVVHWFYSLTSAKVRGGYLRFIAQYVSQIPIPHGDSSGIAELASATDQFLAGNKTPESLLDARVARLYGLTRDEYGLVLEETKPPEEFRTACLDAFDRLEKEGKS